MTDPATRDAAVVPDRRKVVSWCLYDFGNSAFAILFPAYFSLFLKNEVVGDKRLGDLWFGATVSCSMLLVALTTPFLGGIADFAGIRKRMLVAYTLTAVGAVLAFMTLQPGWIVAGFALGALADASFEGGAVFYNSYLPQIAPASHQGRVSALGFATGYVGSLVALGIAAWLSPADRDHIQPLIWATLAIQWLLAAMPAFLVLPPDRRQGMRAREAARAGLRRTLAVIREAWRMPTLRWFLLAYFFFMDGVNTVIVFAATYAEDSMGFARREILGLLALVQVAALLGSLAMGKPTDVKGPRWVVRRVLVWWILVVVAAFLAEGKAAFLVVACLAGLGLGSVQAASRAFMSRLIPVGREAEMFSLYALCGKTGSIMGPLLFGLVGYVAGGQRPAVLSVVVLFVIGSLLLTKTREPTVRAIESGV